MQTAPDEGMAKQPPGKQRVMAATDEGRQQVQQEHVRAGLAPAAAACVAILVFGGISLHGSRRTDIISCNCTVAHQHKCFESLRQCKVERHDLRKTRDMNDQTSIIAKCRQRVLSLDLYQKTAHGADCIEVATDNQFNPLAKKLLDTVGRGFKPPLRVLQKLVGLALTILRKGAEGARRILLLFF